MPSGDFPGPEGMMWTDAAGWVPVDTKWSPFKIIGHNDCPYCQGTGKVTIVEMPMPVSDKPVKD
jgi:hypothetical protein